MDNFKNNFQSNFKARLVKLNDKQKEAVEAVDGPVLVIAGPGSGKTELLSLRTANILDTQDINPSSILLLTFTESASVNMRDRLVSLIGESAYRVHISTFHGFASQILHQYSDTIWSGAQFSPATQVDQNSILENLLKNLSKQNILSSYHPEEGFVYKKSILNHISNLKRAGMTPEDLRDRLDENKREYKIINKILAETQFESISSSRKVEIILPIYLNLYAELKKIQSSSLVSRIISNLELTIKLANEEGKANRFTSFRNEYFAKVNLKNKITFILKDSDEEKQEKLFALVDIYKNYQQSLFDKAVYDFDDMIILVNQKLKESENFKYEISEKYQYIMIDEFQDTNAAQFELVKNINNTLNNNIFAVGDDDQAIYKFQGAELNNIFEFINTFPNTKTIVLDKNYRSTQDILDFARKVIIKAEDRLETRDKNVFKNLISANKDLQRDLQKEKDVGGIIEKSFENEISEIDYVCKEIKNLIENKNVNPNEIAVITRKHKTLQAMSSLMSEYKIPLTYEKRESVLENVAIKELVNIIKFVADYNLNTDENLLPKILSYRFWDLKRMDIWHIAEEVKKGEETISESGISLWRAKSWLTVMSQSKNLKVQNIGKFLIEICVDANSMSLEYLLDKIIGTINLDANLNIAEDEKDDTDYSEDQNNPDLPDNTFFVSPFKHYYFNQENFLNNKQNYLNFLFCLRTFIESLRLYKEGESIYAEDINDFLEIYNAKNGMHLETVNTFASSQSAVQLLTVHKAKGLEFAYVFIISLDDKSWYKSGNSNKIKMPININIMPAGEGDDDKVRLLYVGLTRARHTLYITHNDQKFRFLENSKVKRDASEENDSEVSGEIIANLEIGQKNIYVKEEEILLKKLLENYKMPVTHLSNFLNFTKVGPDKFVEQNLLRFPQAKTPSGIYGTAMHAALEMTVRYIVKNDKFPDIEFVQKIFENNLLKGRLKKIDYDKYLIAGLDNLDIYLKNLQKKGIDKNTKVEVSFRGEDVKLEIAHITGNVDKIEFTNDNQSIIVTDLKTGKAMESWEVKDISAYEKVKLHFYKYQLAFYNLLIKNSRSFDKYKNIQSKIEFIEANKSGEIVILDLEVDKDLEKRVENLANIIYQKVMNLDFPDTSIYSHDLKGVLKFEEDLLNGKI